MNYKMVAIDLDDTLLADDLTISPRTIEAIQEAVKKGIIVTFATGRMYKSAVKYAKKINLDVPIITYQGAYIKNVYSQDVLYQRLIPSELSIDIIKRLKAMNKVVQIYLNDELYVEKDHPYVKSYSKLAEVEYIVVNDLVDKINELKLEAIKILTIDEPENIMAMLGHFSKIYQDKIHVTISKPNFLEFTNMEATKGQAIKFLAEKNAINMEEVIAIGDSYNDFDMIKMAGLGVVMENGHPDIKKIADYITKTNNDCGVWEVLNKFVLNGE